MRRSSAPPTTARPPERGAPPDRRATRDRVLASLLVCPSARTSGRPHGIGNL
jgi:hypothetical protein